MSVVTARVKIPSEATASPLVPSSNISLPGSLTQLPFVPAKWSPLANQGPAWAAPKALTVSRVAASRLVSFFIVVSPREWMGPPRRWSDVAGERPPNRP